MDKDYKAKQREADKALLWRYPKFMEHGAYDLSVRYTDGSIYRFNLDGSIRKIKERDDKRRKDN